MSEGQATTRPRGLQTAAPRGQGILVGGRYEQAHLFTCSLAVYRADGRGEDSEGDTERPSSVKSWGSLEGTGVSSLGESP